MQIIFTEKRKKIMENRQYATKGFVYVILSIVFSISSQAQCAMCRASLESEGNTVKAEAVNDGIIYLMIIPYVLVGIIGVVVYRMYSKKKLQE